MYLEYLYTYLNIYIEYINFYQLGLLYLVRNKLKHCYMYLEYYTFSLDYTEVTYCRPCRSSAHQEQIAIMPFIACLLSGVSVR